MYVQGGIAAGEILDALSYAPVGFAEVEVERVSKLY